MNYDLAKLAVGVLATIGLYSILYRENKMYRLFEHIYIGLAVGYAIVALWTETLHDLWWVRITGTQAQGTSPAVQGHWAWMLLLPIGLLGYTVFNKKYNWMSRIPIGMIIGFLSGQNIQVWFNQYGPQIKNSMLPIIPTTTSFFVPDKSRMTADQAQIVRDTVYGSQAVTNALFVFTLVCVLTYFFFSFDVKNKVIEKMSTMGRWLMMVGFGAIFGSTVAMRFALVIDRMYFIFIEFFKQGLFHR